MDLCPEVSTLSSFSDGELAEDENARLKVHLQKCAACRTRLQNMKTGEELLVRDLRKPMTMEKYFSKEHRERL